jgi:putative aldouronate transport system permease protein
MAENSKSTTISNKLPQPMQDNIFDIVNIFIMILMFVIFTWPLIFVVSASISNPNAVWNGQVVLLPVGLNLNGYKEVLKYTDIWIGYRNTIFYTIVGTSINLLMTLCAAYPLSRKEFVPRNFLMVMFMVSMYFSGGLIPTYLLVKDLHLINTFWAMMIPNAVSIFNIIITRTYFQSSIPESLKEAAELDGANTVQFLIKIVIPLSAPIIAVMALFYGIAHWNSFFNALIYLNSKNLFPLQLFLRDILLQNTTNLDMAGLDPAQAEAKAKLAETIKYSLIIVASVPVLCIYPLIQRFFVKGVMIGAIKG